MKQNVNLVQHLDSALLSELENIPSKLSFKIGEVAELLNVKPYILRYWEEEFSSLHPQKMPGGQRLYFKKDVEMALLIKKLLYKDGFSIKGAKKALIHLKREKRTFKKQSDTSHKVLKNIQHIQENVSAMRSLLN